MYLWPVKLTPKQGVFGPLSFRWIFFSVFMLLNDLYSNFTDPLEKQISIKQDTFWTHVKKGRRTLTANFDFAMNFDWLNNLFFISGWTERKFCKGYKHENMNLFVTSKIEFSNSRILQFLNLKCCKMPLKSKNKAWNIFQSNV